MKSIFYKTNIVLLITLSSFSAVAGQSSAGKTYALIISGISKDTQDRIAKARAVTGLQLYFQRAADNTKDTVRILTAENAANNSSNSSQFSNIQNIMNHFESVISPADRFILYYTGQANVVGTQLRFNLPGEDITQEQFAGLFKNIKASSILIVLDCPASGLAAKALSGTGRIIICSCTAEQRFCPKFSEYFVHAITSTETDLDKDGKTSILEVFISVSKQVEDWYRQQKLIITETPVLEDDGDGKPAKEPWSYVIDMKDGLAASNFILPALTTQSGKESGRSIKTDDGTD